ncbi:MAG: SDR family oxidoreductase [Bacteroidetes bacterium]|nr:SDR family oxidoreductase [Bacteroidota bacterium]
MPKITLITGATAGIGEACAQKFATEGHNLIITGRRRDRLEKLSAGLVKTYQIKVCPLVFDVRDKNEVFKAIDSLDEDWKSIDILINNAGLSQGLDPVQEGNPDDWDTMIDTNVKGLLYVTRAVAPLMMQRGQGHIINIGSIAGKEVYPGGNVYCATKHAVEALSKSMRLDMFRHGIKVSQVSPGAVETEFSMVRFKGDRERAKKVYEGYKPLTAEDIAEVTWFIAAAPSHVNIQDVLVMPMAQANSSTFHKKQTNIQ